MVGERKGIIGAGGVFSRVINWSSWTCRFGGVGGLGSLFIGGIKSGYFRKRLRWEVITVHFGPTQVFLVAALFVDHVFLKLLNALAGGFPDVG